MSSPLPTPITGDMVRIGPIEEQCRRDLQQLKLNGPLSLTLAATAIRLARELDQNPRSSPAMVARELRETIKAIGETAEDDADTKTLHSDLSSPVLDSTNE